MPPAQPPSGCSAGAGDPSHGRVDEDNEGSDDGDVKHEGEVEECGGAEAGVLNIAAGHGASRDVEEGVAAIGDERIDVEEEVGLEGPEALEGDGAGKGELGRGLRPVARPRAGGYGGGYARGPGPGRRDRRGGGGGGGRRGLKGAANAKEGRGGGVGRGGRVSRGAAGSDGDGATGGTGWGRSKGEGQGQAGLGPLAGQSLHADLVMRGDRMGEKHGGGEGPGGIRAGHWAKLARQFSDALARR